MSHDVDWRRQGASVDHIMARKERFDPEIIKEVNVKNPYYNIPNYIYLEEKYNIKSTFFFRTIYENGNYKDYEDDIKELYKGGWEIGLHCDPTSVNDYSKIKDEKNKLENITKSSIKANRSHYLNYNNKLPSILKSLGFSYDSSYKKSKNEIVKEDIGFYFVDGIIEFPVTLMDAYIFTHMHIKEDKIVKLFCDTIDYARKQNNGLNVITVIWHDNVLKMKGGREYERILEFLCSHDEIIIKRGIDLANIILEKNSTEYQNR
jgi:peptidoglycan/xylan/chitin deacetylase (PgdA/CDA1 family)